MPSRWLGQLLSSSRRVTRSSVSDSGAWISRVSRFPGSMQSWLLLYNASLSKAAVRLGLHIAKVYHSLGHGDRQGCTLRYRRRHRMDCLGEGVYGMTDRNYKQTTYRWWLVSDALNVQEEYQKQIHCHNAVEKRSTDKSSPEKKAFEKPARYRLTWWKSHI